MMEVVDVAREVADYKDNRDKNYENSLCRNLIKLVLDRDILICFNNKAKRWYKYDLHRCVLKVWI